VGERRDDEDPAQEPISESVTEVAPTYVATRSTGSARRPSTAGSSRMGTIRTAYVQAVANQVQTRLVPPATKLGSTTSAGSRRMSGQSKVEDSTVAAPAKARAPATNNAPVVRRGP
jgi:hypothetical protein